MTCHPGSLALLAAALALVSVLTLLATNGVPRALASGKLGSSLSAEHDAPETIISRSLLPCVDDLSKSFFARGHGRVNCEGLSELSSSLLITQTCQKNNARAAGICPVTCGVCVPVTPSVPDDSLGAWGKLFDMKLVAIHSMLLPDGKMLVHGGDENRDVFGNGYEIWDTTGDEEMADNHILLKHSTSTIIFCSTASVDVSTGNIVLMGGDTGINATTGTSGYGISDVVEFKVRNYKMRKHPLGDMKYPRWYATSINLPDGRILVVGGKSDSGFRGSSIPEIWDSVSGFRALPGAEMLVTRAKRWWWYSLLLINSSGDILLMTPSSGDLGIYKIDVSGDGSITQIGTKPSGMITSEQLPSIQYDVDRVLLLDYFGTLWTMEISDSTNVIFTQSASLGVSRYHSAMVSLPDGRVAICGGGSAAEPFNGLVEAAVSHIQIWDPTTGLVFTSYGEEQSNARLYHSSSMILPDGRVFSGGGGEPGPVNNLDGQMYSPGYLFDPTTGEPAPRPVISRWRKKFPAGITFVITVDDSSLITKVTATKPGHNTHSRNCDARWLDLEYEVIGRLGTRIRVFTPGPTIMVPGLWMLNVINVNGVPSLGRMASVLTVD